MRNIKLLLLIYVPLTLFSQQSSKKVGVRNRIETALDQGVITHEQADERYAKYRERMSRDNRVEDTALDKEYKKLGVNNLDRIKNGLLNNGIMDSQLDLVLRGMIRLIHGAKADRESFEIDPRMKMYLQERVGLGQKEIQHVIDMSYRIAQRVQ